MKVTRRYSGATREAVVLLGQEVRLARKQRRWTVRDLAERLGASPATVLKIEQGAPTVAIGTVFEAATLVGIQLYQDPQRRRIEQEHVAALLAALPTRVARANQPDDDF